MSIEKSKHLLFQQIEGCGSNSKKKEFGRYLNIAIASCSKVEYLLLQHFEDSFKH
jgi:hypothetical protein